jgi:hypothetical protein
MGLPRPPGSPITLASNELVAYPARGRGVLSVRWSGGNVRAHYLAHDGRPRPAKTPGCIAVSARFDKDEVPGSSPGRPTTPALTSGNAERFLVLAHLSASQFGMRSTSPTSLRSCTARLSSAFVRRLGSAEWCAGPHGGGRAHPLATVASKRSAARRSVGSGRSGPVLAGVVGVIACDAIDRGFRSR